MTTRLSLLWVPLLMFAGWRVCSLALADQHLRDDPARALRYRPTHPRALAADAERHADARRWAQAAAGARAAIAAAPLRSRPYRVLARVAAATGKVSRAYALYRIVARRSPRDAEARIWLFNHHLRSGRADAAMADLDALLRAHPRIGSLLAATLHGMATREELQPAFVAALRSAPPWRADVLALVVREAPDIDGVAALLQRLRAVDGGVEAPVARDFVERLIRERRYDQAYPQWVAMLAPAARERIGNVYDGAFDRAPDGGGFGWRIEPLAGATIEIVPAPGDGGKALRLAFEDRPVAFRNVSQLLLLPAGRHRLQGRAKLEDLRTARGLAWTLSCADGRPIAASEALRGSAPWQSFALAFEVPAGCAAQWLRLELPARVASERRIDGVAWFDDLRVERLPPP
jgi:tetratricopeptide (TPR) repeat protein